MNSFGQIDRQDMQIVPVQEIVAAAEENLEDLAPEQWQFLANLIGELVRNFQQLHLAEDQAQDGLNHLQIVQANMRRAQVHAEEVLNNGDADFHEIQELLGQVRGELPGVANQLAATAIASKALLQDRLRALGIQQAKLEKMIENTEYHLQNLKIASPYFVDGTKSAAVGASTGVLGGATAVGAGTASLLAGLEMGAGIVGITTVAVTAATAGVGVAVAAVPLLLSGILAIPIKVLEDRLVKLKQTKAEIRDAITPLQTALNRLMGI